MAGTRSRNRLLFVAVILVAVAVAASVHLLRGTCRTCFVVEDQDGERMKIFVHPAREDAISMLRDMRRTARPMWEGEL